MKNSCSTASLFRPLKLPVSLPRSWKNYFFSQFVAVHSSSNHSSLSPSSAHVSVTKRLSLAYAAVAYLPTPRPNHPQGPPLPARQGDALSEVYVAGMGCAMIFALWATFAAFFNFLGLTLGESTK